MRDPRAAGMPGGGHRRTAGLRREELAALAGVSIKYLTRLEQGLHPEPSAGVLASLATVLGLSPDETTHLFALAGRSDPRPVQPRVREVPAPVARLVEAAGRSPAAVLNRRRDVLAHNPAATALFGSLPTFQAPTPNLLEMVFLDAAAPRLWAEWALVARDAVAHLRDVAARPSTDPTVTAVVEELRRSAPEFGALWARHDVRCTCGPTTAFDHPRAGRLTFTISTLDVSGGDLQLVVYEPATPDTQTRWPAHLATRPDTALHVV